MIKKFFETMVVKAASRKIMLTILGFMTAYFGFSMPADIQMKAIDLIMFAIGSFAVVDIAKEIKGKK